MGLSSIVQGETLEENQNGNLAKRFSRILLPEDVCFDIAYDNSENPEENMFLGISMGMTPLDVNAAIKYIRIGLNGVSGKLPILIGDRLARHNEFAFSNRSLRTKAADKRALINGLRYRQIIEKAMESLSEEERDRIVILHWDDILTDEYNESVKIMRDEYLSNHVFNQAIVRIARDFFNRRAKSNKNLTLKRLDALANYLLEELPLFIRGLEYQGKIYRILLHPIFTKGSKEGEDSLINLIRDMFLLEVYSSLIKCLKAERSGSFVNIIFHR